MQIQPSQLPDKLSKPGQPPATALSTPPVAPVSPASNKTPQTLANDQVKAVAPVNGNLGKPPVQGKVSLSVSDSDGFLKLSQQDLKATLNGSFTVQPEFILKQMGDLKLGDDMRLKPPRFDADRRQYVLSGKAVDKILGVIDVGFEVRLGTEKGQLAFRVDNSIKRGIIYKALGKQLAKLGIETHRQDGQLLIKPAYSKPITVPLDKQSGHSARIDHIDSSPEQLSFSIDSQGQLTVSLNNTGLTLSSDTRNPNASATGTQDTAKLDLSLSLNEQLQPNLTIDDGSLNVHGDSAALAKVLPASVNKQIREQLGGSLNVKAEQLHGQVNLNQGLKVSGGGRIDIQGEQNAGVGANISASHNKGEKTSLQAQNLTARSLAGQSLSAGSLSLNQGHVSVSDLDGAVSLEGIEAEAQDLTGTLSKGPEGQLKVEADGQLKAKIRRDGINVDVATSGKHQISVDKGDIQVHLEEAEVSGDYAKAPASPDKADKTDKPDKQPGRLRVDIDRLSAKGQAQIKDMKLNAELKDSKVSLDKGQNIQLQTTGSVRLEAQSERIQGVATAQGASVSVGRDGNIEASLTGHASSGSFKNRGNLKVAGKLTGDVSVSVQGDNIVAATDKGTFDARFASGERVSVQGKGGNARLELGQTAAGEQVKIHVEDINLQTAVKAGNVNVKANTRGKQADLTVSGSDLSLQTQGTKSDLDVKVKENVRATGSSGDVSLNLSEGPNGDKIGITARNTDVKAQVSNARKTFNIDAKTRANLDVQVDGSDVTIKASQGQTQADMRLKDKVQVAAEGKSFSVGIKGDDIAVSMEQASFDGKVTPNPKIRVDARTDKASRLTVNVDEGDTGSKIKVETQAALSGKVSIDGKLKTDFSNSSGFELTVDDGEEEVISADVAKLKLDGHVTTPGVNAGVKGEGDLALRIRGNDKISIGYAGDLQGAAALKKAADADYRIDGDVQVELNDKDVDVTVHGDINAKSTRTQFGAQGQVKIQADDHPLRVSVKGKDLNLNLPDGAEVTLSQLQSLNVGKGPQLKDVLGKLESKEIKIRSEQIHAAGANLGLNLNTDPIETHYGSVELGLELDKQGNQLEISHGTLKLTPDMDFYELLRGQLSKKYNINIQGKPRFENGQIHFEGEVRTRSGLSQLARFDLNTTVVDNKLVFEIEKAQVLKVFGANTVGKVLNYVLSKTDIDYFRRDRSSLEISLADIAKDLSLTQGVNFTDLKLVDNRFEVGFGFKSQDQQVAHLAKAGDTAALKALINSRQPSEFSGESLSTAYSALAKAKDNTGAVQLLTRTTRAYSSVTHDPVRYELGRALEWMAKSQTARKADSEDEITLAYLKGLNLNSSQGQALAKALPQNVAASLADNLDQTLSQGGGMRWITSEERDLANQLRRLHGIPENHRPI